MVVVVAMGAAPEFVEAFDAGVAAGGGGFEETCGSLLLLFAVSLEVLNEGGPVRDKELRREAMKCSP